MDIDIKDFCDKIYENKNIKLEKEEKKKKIGKFFGDIFDEEILEDKEDEEDEDILPIFRYKLKHKKAELKNSNIIILN